MCLSVNFVKLLRKPFLQNAIGQLLTKESRLNMIKPLVPRPNIKNILVQVLFKLLNKVLEEDKNHSLKHCKLRKANWI